MLSGGIKKLKALPPSAAFAKTQLKFQRIQICANPRLKQMAIYYSHNSIASRNCIETVPGPARYNTVQTPFSWISATDMNLATQKTLVRVYQVDKIHRISWFHFTKYISPRLIISV
jgi:hypothetical protein